MNKIESARQRRNRRRKRRAERTLRAAIRATRAAIENGVGRTLVKGELGHVGNVNWKVHHRAVILNEAWMAKYTSE